MKQKGRLWESKGRTFLFDLIEQGFFHCRASFLCLVAPISNNPNFFPLIPSNIWNYWQFGRERVAWLLRGSTDDMVCAALTEDPN